MVKRMLDIERLTGFESASQVAKGLETSWIRAAEVGQGPPYQRYQAPINKIWDRAGRRMDGMLENVGTKTRVTVENTAKSGRVQWAIGVIGLENTVAELKIEDPNEDEEEDKD
jgi:hypothetical protein